MTIVKKSIARLGLAIAASAVLAGCVWAPSLDQLNRRLAGMSKQELMYCMGTPARVGRYEDMEFATYSYSYSADSKVLKCEAHLSFLDGRLYRVRVTGGSPGSVDLVSSTCRATVEKCGK